MSVETEDDFQRTLIEVFVQEAQEWLQQIHVALDELQQGPAPDRHLKLAQTIKAGIANLGGSAATVRLNDVEQASYSALPYVEAVQDPAAKISAGDFLALCKQLGQIHSALTRATGVTFEAEGANPPECGQVTVPANNLLVALRGLQEGQPKSASVRRNLIQTVITQVEGVMKGGIGQCNVKSLREFLDRLAAGEEGFLQTVQRHLPGLTEELKRLRTEEGMSERHAERLRIMVEQVAQLWSTAQQVNASQAMSFFMGLHSFLTVIMHRRVAVAGKKYEAVEVRLHECVKGLQRWVEAGQAERTAIGSVLPH